MEIRLERCWHKADGYTTHIWKDGPSRDRFSIAKLGTLEWSVHETGQAVFRQEEHELDLSSRELLTFYNSMQKEMIRLGLLPKPLVEDEVKQLRDQLTDTQKVRDQLLATLDRMSVKAVTQPVITVPDHKPDVY